MRSSEKTVAWLLDVEGKSCAAGNVGGEGVREAEVQTSDRLHEFYLPVGVGPVFTPDVFLFLPDKEG